MGIKKLKECKQVLDEICQRITSESLGDKITEFRVSYEDGINGISNFIGISKETVWMMEVHINHLMEKRNFTNAESIRFGL